MLMRACQEALGVGFGTLTRYVEWTFVFGVCSNAATQQRSTFLEAGAQKLMKYTHEMD